MNEAGASNRKYGRVIFSLLEIALSHIHGGGGWGGGGGGGAPQ